jgi:hypothetical protein
MLSIAHNEASAMKTPGSITSASTSTSTIPQIHVAYDIPPRADTASSTSTSTSSGNTNDQLSTKSKDYTYPEEIQGLRLGLRVARIRKGQLYTTPEQRAKLADIGLVFDYPDHSYNARDTDDAFADSSATMTTNVKIKRRLSKGAASSSSVLSSSTRMRTSNLLPDSEKSGLPVEISVEGNDIRHQNRAAANTTIRGVTAVEKNQPHYPYQAQAVTKIPPTTTTTTTSSSNKEWSFKERTRTENFETIMAALRVHDDLFGDLLVPRYFIVPGEEPWPKKTWGLQLGNRVRNIRAKRAYNTPDFHAKLNDIGFLFDIAAYKMQFCKTKNELDEFDF